jgi:hypothetical protein
MDTNATSIRPVAENDIGFTPPVQDRHHTVQLVIQRDGVRPSTSSNYVTGLSEIVTSRPMELTRFCLSSFD